MYITLFKFLGHFNQTMVCAKTVLKQIFEDRGNHQMLQASNDTHETLQDNIHQDASQACIPKVINC